MDGMDSSTIKFSHSKLEIARQCMLKYKFKYVDHAPTKKDTEATDFGEVMHTIMELYDGGGKEQLLKLYHDLVPGKFNLTEKYRKKVPLALKNIHTYWVAFLSKEERQEHEKEVSVNLNDHIDLMGKIDLFIQCKNGRVKIGDYKTSKSKEYADHTNQLAFYMLLLHKKYNIKYEDMDLEIIYLALDPETKKGKKVLNEGYENISKIYKLTEQDVGMLEMEMEEIYRRIKRAEDSGEWKPNPGWFNCTYCDYKDICTKKWNPED